MVSVRRPGCVAALVGRDARFCRQVERALRIAPARAPVLVLGESGTGKELVARLLHELGPGSAGPFVAVNCGALSRELAESELFGHERGAFTGAGARRAGWFEEAAGGTLVLDEIGELPLPLQPKLLRVLETGRLRRVGGQGEIPVDVRVVALTLRDLRRDAHRGRFRSDLYHRLSVFELVLPSLRERAVDVPLLARHFLRQLVVDSGGEPRAFTEAALAALAHHAWPGNVRELRNVVRRAAVLTAGPIDACDLELGSPVARPPAACRAAEPEAPATALPIQPASHRGTLALDGRRFEEMRRDIYTWALHQHGGSRRRAARALGISRSTFCDVARRLGL
jgi:DNA-binding NtrC family response regulator